MKKEIRQVDEKKGILQITTVDERFYARVSKEKKTGLPAYEYVPSVTWITESYPKGIGFYKWLANKGWDESQALKEAAGDKGSKVHQAVCDLLDNKEVKINSKYLNRDGQEEELLPEEYEAIMSFVDWFKKEKPKMLDREFVVWNDEENYAGTVDLYCQIGKEYYLIDFKTSQNTWPSHYLQLSAYLHAIGKQVDKIAILQLGYKRNKAGYKFTEVDDCYDLFLAAKKIWASENASKQPQQKDYPLALSLNGKESDKK